MTPQPHDDVAGACAAFGLPDFPYRRFDRFAPPERAVAAPEVAPVAPPPPEAPPAPPAAAEMGPGTLPEIGALLPALPQTGSVLPVPFGTLAARIAARRPAVPAAAPLRLIWDPAPPAASAPPVAPPAAVQDSAPASDPGEMFRRL